ncbi:MAG: nucleotidyltransferase domain-containing protein, partial [Pseudomonadota bacterium]
RAPSISSTLGVRFITMTSFFSINFSPSRPTLNYWGGSVSLSLAQRARGEYDKVNDLDFLIVKKDVPLYGLARMRELDELIDRNMAADMLVYRPDEFEKRIKLGDPFIKTVIEEGQVLYG